jgi:superfamily II DNA or RNA helicase
MKQPWALFSLRDEQRDALAMCMRYIDESDPKAQGGVALVCMPTGTGKTAVIAILSHCLPNCRDVLVLTPWLALRDQLEAILRTRPGARSKPHAQAR